MVPPIYNVNPVISTLSREDGKPVPNIYITVPPFNDPELGFTVAIVKGTNSPVTVVYIFEYPIYSEWTRGIFIPASSTGMELKIGISHVITPLT